MFYRKAWRVLLASILVLMAGLPVAAQESASPDIAQFLTSWWQSLAGGWAEAGLGGGPEPADMGLALAQPGNELESATTEVQGCFPPGGAPVCLTDGFQGDEEATFAKGDFALGN